MGLYRQPNEWTCGPFALKHALVALGRLADEQAIAKVAGPHWASGTNEIKLARAARHFGCELPLVRRKNPDRARAALTRHVANHLPAILCVDEWDHWITVVGHERDRFVVIDSRYEPVLQVAEWRRLRARWCYVEHEDFDEPTSLYDMHPVKPRFRVPVKAQFSVERVRFLRRPENACLAKHWNDYLEDLLQICRPRSGRGHVMSMAEFLRRHQDMLVSRVVYWHGHVGRDDVVRVLRNFRFVAETYGLVIPESGSRTALVDLSMLLAFWAAASGGVDSMYGSGDDDDPSSSSRASGRATGKATGRARKRGQGARRKRRCRG